MATERVHYVDWLRFAAVLAVVIFHALLPFGSVQPWVIRNAEQSDAVAWAAALLPFAFPVFFLLAGASAERALRTRTLRTFLAERAARLLVPFALGSLVLTPVTAFVIGSANGTAPGSFLAFLAAYPASVGADIVTNVGFSPAAFETIGMHLWFLAWLFLWCLIAAPAILWLRTRAGAGFVDWIARRAGFPGASLLLALPLALIALPLFRISSTAGWDWAVFGLWGGTFVLGYLIFSDERLVAAVRRDLGPSAVAAVIGIGGLAATGFTDSIFRGGAHTSDATYLLLVLLHAMSVWGVTLSVLSAGMRARRMQRPLNPRWNELALPTYLLHYPIVIASSAIVVDLPVGLWPKAAINVAIGLAVTLVVVGAVIRIRPVRPLLGLRGAQAWLPTGTDPAGAAAAG